MFEPRYYQTEAHNSFFNHFVDKGSKKNALIVMPTGTGKSPVIGMIIGTALYHFPLMRFLVLTSSKDLVEQDTKAINWLNPNIPVGICCSGLGRTDVAHPVIVGSPGTVEPRTAMMGRINVIVVDEAQDVSDEEASQYRKIITALKIANPDVVVVGLTATPYRLKMGMLTDGGVFEEVIYDCSTREHFEEFIRQGWLVPLVSGRTAVQYDRSKFQVRAGEFTEASMNQEALNEAITQECVNEFVARGANRHCGLGFSVSIEHAEMITDMILAAGETATVIHSKLKKKQRDERMREFKRGEHKYLINKDIYTVGFDHRPVDILGIFRPTQSPGLWVQILGRGIRPYDPETADAELARFFPNYKSNCLVCDFAANIESLGPIDSPVIPKSKTPGNGDAPVRICPIGEGGCGAYNHASARFCGGFPHASPGGCGKEFHNQLRIDTFNAGSAEMMSFLEEKIIEEFNVQRVIYSNHQKDGRPDCLKVTYYTERKSYNEFVFFEGSGFARKKAEWWFRKRCKLGKVPATVGEVLSMTSLFATPRTVKVHTNKRPHPEILGHEFHSTENASVGNEEGPDTGRIANAFPAARI